MPHHHRQTPLPHALMFAALCSTVLLLLFTTSCMNGPGGTGDGRSDRCTGPQSPHPRPAKESKLQALGYLTRAERSSGAYGRRNLPT